MHNSLIWLFAKGAMKTLPCGMFGLAKDIRLAKLWGSTPPTHHNLDRVSRLLDKGAKIVNGVINTTLVEITHAADHEITMARECNDNGFEMVQDFKGDDLYSQHALKREPQAVFWRTLIPSVAFKRPRSGISSPCSDAGSVEVRSWARKTPLLRVETWNLSLLWPARSMAAGLSCPKSYFEATMRVFSSITPDHNSNNFSLSECGTSAAKVCVAGHIHSPEFRKFWFELLQISHFLRDFLICGYRIPLFQFPPSVHLPNNLSAHTSENVAFIEKSLHQGLRDGLFVEDAKPPHLFLPIQVVERSGKKKRFVIDASRSLNNYIRKRKHHESGRQQVDSRF
ncbi:hypothetical protein TCAL_15651 [Tigriopus californicus]|uniref:Uncharacterized protein n=1 Tax=Tigriopus californicus TaxID=6832 RepID=A0A553P9X8_TIGCA|nr:hypothetical protein TCAL_15651 [Tigriopus californicus]